MSQSGGDGTLWLTTGQTVVKGSTFRYVSGPPSGVRDVDHDGTLDLQFGGSFARGLGGGSFADVLGFPTAFEFVLSLGASLADHTGDGEADAYTSNYSVRECYSSGRCETRPRGPALFVWSKGSKRYEYHSAPPLAAVSVRDYTGDGIPDLLAEKVFARGLGNGSFASPEPLPPLSTMEKLRLGLTYHSLAADADGDGLTDILKIRGEWLDVMRGQEDGELAPPVTVFAPSVAESLLSNYPDYHPTVRLVDIDDDGLPELVWQSVQGFAALRFTRR
ncbi:MAG TPA: VCBS repeat-containing protein, partial [Myxococcus sp.]|nr:VCBS repeat-containing protein [Myxococcus sp.]